MARYCGKFNPIFNTSSNVYNGQWLASTFIGTVHLARVYYG